MTQEERLAEQERLKAEFSENCTVKGFEKYYEVIDGYPETFVADKKSGWTPIRKRQIFRRKTGRNLFVL